MSEENTTDTSESRHFCTLCEETFTSLHALHFHRIGESNNMKINNFKIKIIASTLYFMFQQNITYKGYEYVTCIRD